MSIHQRPGVNEHRPGCNPVRIGAIRGGFGRNLRFAAAFALCLLCVIFVKPQDLRAAVLYAQQVIPAEKSDAGDNTGAAAAANPGAAAANTDAAANSTPSPVNSRTAEKSTRKGEKLIRIAEAEIGTSTKTVKEKTKYEKETFGSNGHLWCASFVSWCANKAGVSRKRIPRSMSTLSMAERAGKNYKAWNAGSWKKLRRGDVIFFSPRKAKLRYAGGGKAVHHVGIVRYVDRENKLLYTVEGNVSRITKTGKIDLTRRVVRDCVYLMKPKTGKILKSETWFFDGEYICGTIAVK